VRTKSKRISLVVVLCIALLMASSAGAAPDAPRLEYDESTGALPTSEPDLPQAGPLRSDAAAPGSSGGGARPPAMDLSHLDGQASPEWAAAAALPSAFDWRDSGKVSSVKHQYDCGACYSFAAIGNIESKLLIDDAGAYDFSENHAKECNWREITGYENPPGNPLGSCDGGNYSMLASLFSQAGLMLEADDPYDDEDVACSCTSGCAYVKSLLDWRIISGNAIASTDVLKQYILSHGPIFTMMDTVASEGFDSSYDGSYTFDYTMPGLTTDHCVLIVGWSDDLPPVPGGDERADGWIVKNSWGASWGADGYFYATYGSANLGMYSSYMYDWQDYDPSGDVWFYDEDGWTGRYGYGDAIAWGLARFTPDVNTEVVRVEFWTTDATTDVDVFLYDSFDGSTPGNLLGQVLNQSFSEAGYHSVPLGSPIPVYPDDDVFAVIAITNASDKNPIAVDANGPFETGTTYLSHHGTSWSDLGINHSVDAAIRLRTRPAAPAAPGLVGIVPSSGSNTGIVHITDLNGSNFQSGATVKLTRPGQSPIGGSSVSRVSASRITCDFDLTGADTGLWNVVVTNPDLQSATLLNGFTVTAPSGEEHTVYLPSVLKHYPPVPGTPFLNTISNPDGDGNYSVSWTPAYLANTYTLEEDDHSAFSSPSIAYAGPGTSVAISGKSPGTYFYRVKATNTWGDSGWSNQQQVRVSPSLTQVYVNNETGDTLCYEVYGTGIGEKCFSSGEHHYGNFESGTYTWHVSAWCGSATESSFYPVGEFIHRFWCD